MVLLQSERIRLRTIEESDLKDIFHWWILSSLKSNSEEKFSQSLLLGSIYLATQETVLWLLFGYQRTDSILTYLWDTSVLY
jgi:hypothetical protein